MYEAVGANTNSSNGKMYRRTAKIALTFKQSDGEAKHTFHCITYQGKQNGSVLLTNKWCTEQLE